MPVVDASKIPAPAAGYATERVQATSEVAPNSTDNVGAFRVVCMFSHMNFDDAIVFPGGTGTTHLHSYFGNTGSNGNSTALSLRTTGNSTCDGGTVNRSSYWVPTMIDSRTGVPVAPRSIVVYYKTGYSGIKSADIKPLPEGLRMIAGNSKATGPAGPIPRPSWDQGPRNYQCDDSGVYGETIPVCGANTDLVMMIPFPQCWDGVNLDSPDHKSHMAYPSGGACPASHPVPLPEVGFNVRFSTGPAAGATAFWRLSSDNYPYTGSNAGYSIHGDWFNGWKPDVMNTWVRNCINANKDCHAHLLGNGQMIY
jgi:hypothetical protein